MTPFIGRIIVQPMGGNPPPTAPTLFSPDGFWWWDGAQWRSALSPDGIWRWDGRSWVPNRPIALARRGGGATAVIITIAAFAGIVGLVTIVTVVVLLSMGNQISNVFSNVAAALASSPSP
jgi:Flp pilus assembly pilin Flp